MDKAGLDHFKNILQEEKARLEEMAFVFEDRGIRENFRDTAGELAAYDQHDGDYGSQLFEREKDLGLLENIRDKVTLVNQALDRVTTGEYGVCQWCHREIGWDRLEAMPYAALCIDCRRKEENGETNQV